MTTVLAVLVVGLALLLLLAASRPSTFELRRSATIAATPERIYSHLEDFHKWGAWSPWEKLDPALVRTYGGAASGPGAVYEWSGNKKVGRGRMEITSAIAPARLVIKLDFMEPFEAHNVTEFALAPAGARTAVTWTMTGTNNFMAKVMGIVINMDKMVGKDFEAGLANLKSVAEA